MPGGSRGRAPEGGKGRKDTAHKHPKHQHHQNQTPARRIPASRFKRPPGYHLDAMSDSVVDCKADVKQATKYVKETENVAEKYSALTVSKNSSDVNMNVGEMPSAAFTAVPTLKSVKKVRVNVGHRRPGPVLCAAAALVVQRPLALGSCSQGEVVMECLVAFL